MRFLTDDEAGAWCQAAGFALGAKGLPAEPSKDLHRIRTDIPPELSRAAWFCRFVEATLQPRQHCLLWVTGWGIWESSENWHLYYRMRQGYGDHRLIDEAPGHLFLDYERPDLVSFLQIGLTSGWDIHLLPSQGYGQAFLSHDEWVEFAMTEADAASEIEAALLRDKTSLGQ